MLRCLRFRSGRPPATAASAEQLALAAWALRRARLAPDVAAAGFLWAAKDGRRAWKILADVMRR